MPFPPSHRSILAVLVFMAVVVSPLSAQDLADGYREALKTVSSHLSNPRLISAYGTPAFSVSGRRVDDVFLNFCGQDAGGRWMLMSLTLHSDGSLDGEDDAINPRPDEYGHHLKRPIELDAWVPPEELVLTALRLHEGHPAPDRISLAYYTSGEHGGRTVIVLYWLAGNVIHDVVFDARYGDVLGVGETVWPGRQRAPH